MTDKQYSYDLNDAHDILDSDLMEDKSNEKIDEYMHRNRKLYDQAGE